MTEMYGVINFLEKIQMPTLPALYGAMLAGVDANKDQSYFLYTLGQAQLARALFPVGALPKSEVLRIALRDARRAGGHPFHSLEKNPRFGVTVLISVENISSPGKDPT